MHKSNSNNLRSFNTQAICLTLTMAAAFAFTSTATAEPAINPPDRFSSSHLIKYCVQLDNPPYGYKEEGDPKGVAVELAQEIANTMELETKLINLKFASLIPALQAEQCDMVVDELYITPERKKVISQIPYAVSAAQTVVREGDEKGIDSISDLSGKKVAIAASTTYEQLARDENKKLEEAGKEKIDMLLVPSQAAAFNNLASGTAFAVGTTLASSGYHKSVVGGGFVNAGEPFNKVTDGFGLRKEDTELQEAVKESLSYLMESGKYTEILEKYNLEDAAIED